MIDRLLEACVTGERCPVARGIPAISYQGFRLLAKRQLWAEATDALLQLDRVHPKAQRRFVEAWSMVSFSRYMPDTQRLIALLRKVMPPYHGEDQCLFRGQLQGAPLGVSWTVAPHIALKFAWFGERNVEPIELALDGPKEPTRDGAILLSGVVPASAIISATCLVNALDGEYIIDPRGLDFLAEPPEQAVERVRGELLQSLSLCVQLSAQLESIRSRHGADAARQAEDLVTAAVMAEDVDALWTFAIAGDLSELGCTGCAQSDVAAEQS